jgi:hypothetical protein
MEIMMNFPTPGVSKAKIWRPATSRTSTSSREIESNNFVSFGPDSNNLREPKLKLLGLWQLFGTANCQRV